jgi:hypothetical protein
MIYLLEFVQEPCIIAMLRLRADCDTIPSEVIDTISVIAQSARSSIQVVCLSILKVVFGRCILTGFAAMQAISSLLR